jgi:transcriptional regulator with XRE-family HTH domain
MKDEKEKNPYLFCRKQRGLSRDDVNEQTGMSTDRLGDIEKGERNAEPEDIVSLSECYKMPRLCNYYCANECVVGKKIGYKEIGISETEELAKIFLEILYCLDDLKNIDEKRLVEISRDGKISDDEFEDFTRMKDSLRAIAAAYNALELWENETKATELWEKDKEK